MEIVKLLQDTNVATYSFDNAMKTQLTLIEKGINTWTINYSINHLRSDVLIEHSILIEINDYITIIMFYQAVIQIFHKFSLKRKGCSLLLFNLVT